MRKVEPIEVGIAFIPPVGAKEIDYRIVRRIYPDGHPKSPTYGHFKFLHLTSSR
jgi:hypothetical protein